MSSLLLLISLLYSPSDTLMQSPLHGYLPHEVHGWQPSEPAQTYTGREIFRYMDGAGEVYLAYGFQSMLVQRYARPSEEEILVEVFDMGSPRNAYGVFTHMQGRGPRLSFAQGAEYKSGLLALWKGNYFVCVAIDNETPKAREAVLAIGTHIASSITVTGKEPDILSLLPSGEYESTTLRYFFRHEILNIHFYLSEQNVLDLDEQTDAVLVHTKTDGNSVLLVRYPSAACAEAGYSHFRTDYLSVRTPVSCVQIANGKWAGCAKHGQFVVVVLDAATEDQARSIMDSFTRSLP